MKKGLTLVEIMVVTGILALVTGLIFAMTRTGGLGWDTHNIQLELQQQARRGLDEMLRDLYQTASNQITVDTATADEHVITFKVPVVVSPDTDIYDDTGVIRWGGNGVEGNWIRYRQNTTSNQLLRQVLDSSLAAVSEKVCGINVSGLNTIPEPASFPRTLSVTITCTKSLRSGGTSLSANMTSRVTFRN